MKSLNKGHFMPNKSSLKFKARSILTMPANNLKHKVVSEQRGEEEEEKNK